VAGARPGVACRKPVLVAAVTWQALQLAGALLLGHKLRGATSTYGRGQLRRAPAPRGRGTATLNGAPAAA
jgi:hypothetical protein